MSELFGKEASNHMMKNNIMKDDFGWEVPVESVPLPSRGVIYSPDSTVYNAETVQIKAMTALEEDILMSQPLIKNGTVITELIKSCVIDKSIDVDSLTLGDRNALMISIRITGYGPQYELKPKCENCSEENNVTVDLSGLEIKRLNIEPVEAGKNQFEFTLPVTKKKVVFQFLTGYSTKERDAKQKFFKKMTNNKRENNITSFLEEAIISVDGINDKNKITHFIKNMPALDSRKLRDFMLKQEPGIKMEYEFECQNCSHHNKLNLPIGSNFFWPRS